MTTGKARKRKKEGMVPRTGTSEARKKPHSTGAPWTGTPGGSGQEHGARTGTSGEEPAGRQQGHPDWNIRGAKARDGGSRRRRE